jgi:DNA polymerase bacteriophage-type
MNALAHDIIELERGAVVPILSKAMRAMFVAAPGKRYIGGDFANVEGRVNAWLAGEQWKLDAYRAFDQGVGPDLYKLAYSRTFGIPVTDVTKIQRQIGKTEELAFGYQGSVGAWLRFDSKPEVVTRVVREQSYGSEAWLRACEQYDRATKHYGLSADQWIAIKVIVNGWRDGHPQIMQNWWDLQDAAIQAVDEPGIIVESVQRRDHTVALCGGRVKYMVAEDFLWCRLPSGKLLAYCRPRLVEVKEDFLVDADGEIFPVEEFTADEIAARIAAGAKVQEGRVRTQVSYQGKNQKTGAWGSQRLYGGAQCNNVVQGTARELLRIAMHSVENHGYPITLHVHDEVVTEVDEAFGSPTELESLMSILPPWAEGLPLVAKAWSDGRYVK